MEGKKNKKTPKSMQMLIRALTTLSYVVLGACAFKLHVDLWHILKIFTSFLKVFLVVCTN